MRFSIRLCGRIPLVGNVGLAAGVHVCPTMSVIYLLIGVGGVREVRVLSREQVLLPKQPENEDEQHGFDVRTKQKAGCSMVGSFLSSAPASITKMDSSGSALARRAATMQPAVPPGVVVSVTRESLLYGGIICLPPATIISTSVMCSGSSAKMPILSESVL